VSALLGGNRTALTGRVAMTKRHRIAAEVASAFPLIGIATMAVATAVYAAITSAGHHLHTHG
jgi:hypothetical protein